MQVAEQQQGDRTQLQKVNITPRMGGGQRLTSLHFRNSMLLHEIFELGGKISHDSGGSEVKGPLKVLLLIKHPDVDLNSEIRGDVSVCSVVTPGGTNSSDASQQPSFLTGFNWFLTRAVPGCLAPSGA